MSMAKVQKNIDDLERKVVKSNKIVSKGDKLSLGDAIKLGRKSNSINSTIRKGIKEYDGATPTDEEARKILAQMEKVVDLTEQQLNGLVAAKPRFESLKVAGLVKKNMKSTGEASADLEKVMLEKAPADIKPKAAELAKRREAAFAKANAAFADSTGGEDQADGEDDSD